MNNIITVLRFFASFLVLLYHYTYRYFERNDENGYELFMFGKVGVEMFFVISGYLLINSVEKYEPRTFIKKRIRRIYPTYLSGMFLTMIIVFALLERTYSFGDLVANILFLNIPLGINSIDGVYWTLFIEVCFYAMLFFLSIVAKRVPAVFIWLAVATLILRMAKIDHTLISILSIFSYGWLFASGAALRLFHKTNSLLYIFLGLLLLLGHSYYVNMSLTELAVLLFTYVIIEFSSELNRLQMPKSLVFLGTISYPVYLIHQEIGYALFDVVGWSKLVVLFVISLVVFIGWLLNKYVETRFA